MVSARIYEFIDVVKKVRGTMREIRISNVVHRPSCLDIEG